MPLGAEQLLHVQFHAAPISRTCYVVTSIWGLCFTWQTVSAHRADDDDMEEEVDAVAEEEEEGREEGQGEEGQGQSKKARDIADARSG